jgi:predicted Rossmann fold nucleotide-binding protein DprA/Smf involved in DNA uptake
MKSMPRAPRKEKREHPPLFLITPMDPRYPAHLKQCLGCTPPPTLRAIGNPELLLREKIGLVCSVRIPGRVILQTYEFAKHAPQEGPVMVGGFHSPMERQCLEIFLLRKVPLIICLARSIRTIRIPASWKESLAEGRLLILSAVESQQRRPTKVLAQNRNRVVAALSDRILVPYATPGGKTDGLVGQAARWGKILLTFEDAEGSALSSIGALIIR